MPGQAANEQESTERLIRLERRVLRLEAILWLAISLAMIAPLAAVLVLVPRPSSLLWSGLFNSAHVMLSAVVAWSSLALSRRLVPPLLFGHWQHYLISFSVVMLLGGGLELVQLVAPGEASLSDLIRDAAGGGMALLVSLSLDREFPGLAGATLQRWLLRLAALVLGGISLFPTVRSAASAAQRANEFPMLADFEKPVSERLVLAANSARLTLVAPVTGFSKARGARVGRVDFGMAKYPKLEFGELGGDWAEYTTLALDLFSPESAPVEVQLRIHDRAHNNQYADRFNQVLTIYPGETTLEIPVERIQAGPESRVMDMSQIRSLILFLVEPSQPVTLYFDSLRLEGPKG